MPTSDPGPSTPVKTVDDRQTPINEKWSEKNLENDEDEEMNRRFFLPPGYRYFELPSSSQLAEQKSGAISSSTTLPCTSSAPTTTTSSPAVVERLRRFGDVASDSKLATTPSRPNDDLSRVPPAVIIQLEKANRTIASQTLEIERLRASDQQVETDYLRAQVNELEREMQSSRERFLEQEELLAEMNHEMEVLLREKRAMQASYLELEKKYKRAKLASKELTKILENDVMCLSTPSRLPAGSNSIDRTPDGATSLVERSRAMAIQQESEDRRDRSEALNESVRHRKASKAEEQTKEILQRVLVENEDLLLELERERRTATSLHDDLETNRRLEIMNLKEQLKKADSKALQCENDLSRTSTDLALERARCDALTLELHELDAMFTQTQSTTQAYAMENEELIEKCRQAQQAVITLNAKLEAQGIDLINTKRTLRNLQQNVPLGTN
ncbi:unnamed protein product [Caenorhabditis auriculariae]|uniref:Uncharacterized protein n=1 Tax=Caenorhabditis auriculariae TaxID=2777116 RepID=A0A8S1GW87_9PELO|nr:unnamed protein product [Caenorhabditis auriculariae]